MRYLHHRRVIWQRHKFLEFPEVHSFLTADLVRLMDKNQIYVLGSNHDLLLCTKTTFCIKKNYHHGLEIKY